MKKDIWDFVAIEHIPITDEERPIVAELYKKLLNSGLSKRKAKRAVGYKMLKRRLQIEE